MGKAEKTRKAMEAKIKAEAETVERARAWVKSKAEDKVDITRVNAEYRERARTEAKERARDKTNAIQRVAAEAAAKIRVKAEA